MSDGLTEDLVINLLKSWKPNDPLERLKLGSPVAPHEVRGELRMHRAGHDANSIRKILRIRGTTLINALSRALANEEKAYRRGLPIHDAPIRRGG